jgi:hypothetical protein
MNPFRRILLCAALTVPVPALADQVTCESTDGRRVECSMNTRGEVKLVRQLSRTQCIEDTNWGLNRSSIWVDAGCRGVFASGAELQQDYGGDSAYGRAPTGGADPDQVTCESIGGRRVECDMNTHGRVRVLRQLSRTACIEDTNWGLNRSSVWVDGGCRAVFAREAAGSDAGGGAAGPATRAGLAREDAQFDSSGRAPAAALSACNAFADQGYDGTVVSQNGMKPGWWEIVLRYEDYRYVCNVSSAGQVESFDKID